MVGLFIIVVFYDTRIMADNLMYEYLEGCNNIRYGKTSLADNCNISVNISVLKSSPGRRCNQNGQPCESNQVLLLEMNHLSDVASTKNS